MSHFYGNIVLLNEGGFFQVEDVTIIELFHKRSETAITGLLQQYGDLLRRLARNILPTEEDVEEVINDAALDVWNSVPPQTPHSLSAYACVLVRHRALDRYRYLSASKRHGPAEAIMEELDECASSEDVGEYLDRQELHHLLNEFLASLEARDRVLFVKRYFYSENTKAIAREMVMKENTVSVRLSRLRTRLKQFLLERGVTV